MSTLLGYILLALGFGFVIFWHELGHFLAAKWAGVKVEQFAVGFGTAALAWRKGIGFRARSTRAEYDRRCREYLRTHEAGSETTKDLADATNDDQRLDAAGRALGLGETEYRLNWLPLGGYVKMLGQDDLNPNAIVNDPRAYNTQTISKRMVIVSAGVVMNIILAAMLFFGLFLMGFNVAPSIAGVVLPGSPAQQAGLQVGDKIIKLDGDPQYNDFTKIILSVALLDDSRPTPVEIERPTDDGNVERKTLTIRPTRAPGDDRGILVLGIYPSLELRGYDSKKLIGYKFVPATDPPAQNQVRPDETIVEIAGRPVSDPHKDYYVLDRAMQRSAGKPVPIKVKQVDGQIREELVQPMFMRAFGERDVDFFGLAPRAVVSQITSGSLAKGKLQQGDVVLSALVLAPNGSPSTSIDNPSRDALRTALNAAGQNKQKVQLTVLRDGKPVPIEPIEPSLALEGKQKGLGIGLVYDELNPMIASLRKGSAAQQANIPPGSTLVSIDGKPVSDWHDVRLVSLTLTADRKVPVVVRLPDSKETQTFELATSAEDLAQIASYQYTHGLDLRERIDPRQTNNPVEAAAWGARETRDLILQFYLTLKRMFQRSIPLSNAMGPVGIVQAGARLSERGNDWLVWFLAQISANLAVVNFLPIPIVDGGLFLFLIIEKLQGRPLSTRTQSIAQVVGLALIVSVFLFVTYQDIMR